MHAIGEYCIGLYWKVSIPLERRKALCGWAREYLLWIFYAWLVETCLYSGLCEKSFILVGKTKRGYSQVAAVNLQLRWSTACIKRMCEGQSHLYIPTIITVPILRFLATVSVRDRTGFIQNQHQYTFGCVYLDIDKAKHKNNQRPHSRRWNSYQNMVCHQYCVLISFTKIALDWSE